MVCGLVAACVLLGAPASSQAATCIGETAPITSDNIQSAELALLCRVNVYRQASGLGAVVMDTSLRTAARNHSQDMIDRGFFAHVNPDGKDPGDRAVAAGYPNIYVGENIASNCCTASAFDLFEQWRKSTLGHNENMLGPDWKVAGMGLAYSISKGAHGTQLFGSTETGTTTDTGLQLLDSDDDGVPDSGAITTPETTITSAPRRTRDRTPTFKFESDAAGATFTCQIDDGDARDCGSPFTSKRLSTGKHTITVTAFDSTGIPDSSPATRSFTIKKKRKRR